MLHLLACQLAAAPQRSCRRSWQAPGRAKRSWGAPIEPMRRERGCAALCASWPAPRLRSARLPLGLHLGRRVDTFAKSPISGNLRLINLRLTG